MARPPRFVGFSIGIAAERTGMHPQTLREYERKGLVRPYRTAGGARRYRDQEIERLRRIQQLTEQGLSLLGVAYVLRLEETLQVQSAKVAELELRLQRYEPDAPRSHAPASNLPVRHSTSLEIVHIPRRRRSPRWTNEQG